MSEQIKPVAWAVPNTSITERHKYMQVLLDISGAQYPQLLVPLYDEAAVQQLQDKVSQLKDALEWEEIAHHAERNKARAEENDNTSLREQVQQLQRDLEIEKQRVVDLGVLCLESVPRESLEKQRVLYEMAVNGRADIREALRNERDKVQQLQRENAELRSKNAAHEKFESSRLELTRQLRAELAAARQQLADYRYSYADTLVTMQLMREEIELTSKNFRELQQSINNDTIVISGSEVRDTEIGAAVNRACRDLPEGYVIVICLEKDAGDIQLQCPDDNFSRNDFEHEADTFGGQINAAIDFAVEGVNDEHAI